jgi:hypothetical protein
VGDGTFPGQLRPIETLRRLRLASFRHATPARALCVPTPCHPDVARPIAASLGQAGVCGRKRINGFVLHFCVMAPLTWNIPAHSGTFWHSGESIADTAWNSFWHIRSAPRSRINDIITPAPPGSGQPGRTVRPTHSRACAIATPYAHDKIWVHSKKP